MKSMAYIETSVVSYLTSRPSRDVVIAGRQQSTRDWWATATERFELVISQLVLDEASIGDPEAARFRLRILDGLTLLEAGYTAMELATSLVRSGAVPQKASDDAIHIAIAVTHGVDYLLSWNFRHIANAAMRKKIAKVCELEGYDPTILCTPADLMEFEDEAQND